ncbi:MAG: hypothetical protein GX303_05640 [Clostridiales bacterium]|nr:hypothetical protein [Clostridiales bacterium]
MQYCGLHPNTHPGKSFVSGPTGETTINYIIKYGDKVVLYACDTAWFICESWHEIRRHKFDAVILDCTVGDVEGDYRIFEHNNIGMVEIMAQTMRKCGVINAGGRIIVSHMARTLHTSHAELRLRLETSDILPAYDGMTVCL